MEGTEGRIGREMEEREEREEREGERVMMVTGGSQNLNIFCPKSVTLF